MITVRCGICKGVYGPSEVCVTKGAVRNVTTVQATASRNVTPCKRCEALKAEVETLKRQLAGLLKGNAERQRRFRDRKKAS